MRSGATRWTRRLTRRPSRCQTAAHERTRTRTRLRRGRSRQAATTHRRSSRSSANVAGFVDGLLGLLFPQLSEEGDATADEIGARIALIRRDLRDLLRAARGAGPCRGDRGGVHRRPAGPVRPDPPGRRRDRRRRPGRRERRRGRLGLPGLPRDRDVPDRARAPRTTASRSCRASSPRWPTAGPGSTSTRAHDRALVLHRPRHRDRHRRDRGHRRLGEGLPGRHPGRAVGREERGRHEAPPDDRGPRGPLRERDRPRRRHRRGPRQRRRRQRLAHEQRPARTRSSTTPARSGSGT